MLCLEEERAGVARWIVRREDRVACEDENLLPHDRDGKARDNRLLVALAFETRARRFTVLLGEDLRRDFGAGDLTAGVRDPERRLTVAFPSPALRPERVRRRPR